MPGVADAIRVSQPFKLVSREVKEEDTVLDVGGAKLGGKAVAVMAGPCSVESMQAESLTIATGVHAGGGPVPVSFGFHPYFGLAEAAARRLELEPARDAPPRARRQRDTHGGFGGPFAADEAPLGQRDLDEAFCPAGRGGRVLDFRWRAPHRLGATRRLTRTCRSMRRKDKAFIAIEPMTAPTNALISGNGLRLVVPGAMFGAAFRINSRRRFLIASQLIGWPRDAHKSNLFWRRLIKHFLLRLIEAQDRGPMHDPNPFLACEGCSTPLDFDISMAFQPIVDVETGRRLRVRGAGARAGQARPSVLGPSHARDPLCLRSACRVAAIEGAAAAGILRPRLSCRSTSCPTRSTRPACIQLTLKTARARVSADRLIFEFTEDEEWSTRPLETIFESYKQWVSDRDRRFRRRPCRPQSVGRFQPDFIKLDMALVPWNRCRHGAPHDHRPRHPRHLPHARHSRHCRRHRDGWPGTSPARPRGLADAGAISSPRPAFEALPPVDVSAWCSALRLAPAREAAG